MDINSKNLIIIATCCGISFVAGIVTAWLVGIKDRISDIIVSKSGLRVHTNSWMAVNDITHKIEQIDASTKKAIRKVTESLTILPPEKFGTSDSVMLINMKANNPLLHAAHENHFTHELQANCAERYIAEKKEEILSEIRYCVSQYPNLPQLADNHIYLWTKYALIPNVRRACNEKLEYYEKLYDEPNVIDSLRKETARKIKKNNDYLAYLEELSERTVIRDRSCIINSDMEHPDKDNSKGDKT